MQLINKNKILNNKYLRTGTTVALYITNVITNVLFNKLMEVNMLNWAVTFFVIAIIAAIFGFGGIAGAAAGMAKIIFFIFIVLLVISLIANALRGKAPRP